MSTTHNSVVSADSPPIAGAWRVDAERSRARFVATTLRGAVKVRGAFRSLSGSLVVAAEGASGALMIDAASVDTGNRLRDRHLRGRDFFGAVEHPQLRYELRSLTPSADDLVAVEGDLVIAGTRTALPLEASLRQRADGGVEIACGTRVDRLALGVRGARAMVPRSVELDVCVALRPASTG
jgi:polyisoprenoid-binding protein YceI